MRRKIIRLSKNLGFAGGNNVDFMARDRESKYVFLLNNDAVLLQHGLNVLVEYAEGFERLGGLQDVILRCGAQLTEAASNTVDELPRPHLLDGGDAHP